MANGTIADAISVINNADSTGEQVRDAIVDIVELIEDPNRDAKYLVDPLHPNVKHDSNYFATVDDKSALDAKLGDTAEMINIIEYGYTSGYYKLKSNLVLDGSLPEDDRIWTTNVKNKVIAWDEITAKNFIVEVIGGTGSSSASGATTWELLKTYDRTTDSAGKFSIRWGAHAEKIKVNVYCLVSKGSEDLDWTPNEWTVLQNNIDLLNDQVNKQCYGPVHVRIPTIAEKVISENGTYDIANETSPAEGEYAGYKTVKVDVPTSEPTLQEKIATVNNTVYTPDSGYDGLSQVTVQVPIPAPTLQSKTVDSNGTYTADSGYDGLSQVVVSLPLGIKNITENGVYNSEDESTPLRGFNQVRVKVPTPEPNLQNKTVTVNGPVTADTGYDGLGTVTVNVSGGSVNPITVKTVNGLFQKFNGNEIISKWDLFNLSNITTWDYAFQNVVATMDFDLTGISHGVIASASNLFSNANINGDIIIPAGMFTASCTNTSAAFRSMTQYPTKKIIIDGNNVFKGNCSNMFESANRLIKFQNGAPDFSQVVDASYMFNNCYWDELVNVFADLDFSSATNISRLCAGTKFNDSPSSIIFKDIVFGSISHTCGGNNLFTASQAESISFDNVTWNRCSGLHGMFQDCYYVTDIDLRGLNFVYNNDTPEFTSFEVFFACCRELETIRWMNSLDMSKVTSTYRMFYQCNALIDITFPSWFDTSNVTNMWQMFNECYRAENIEFPDSFNTSKVNNMGEMFSQVGRAGDCRIFLPTAFTAAATNNKPFNYTNSMHPLVHVFTPAAEGDQSLGTINSRFIMHYGVSRSKYESITSIDRTEASGAVALHGADMTDFTIWGMGAGAEITYYALTNESTLVGKHNSNYERIYKLISGLEIDKKYMISFIFNCDQTLTSQSGILTGAITTEPNNTTQYSSNDYPAYYYYYANEDVKYQNVFTATATDMYIFIQFADISGSENRHLTFKDFKVIEIVDENSWTF